MLINLVHQDNIHVVRALIDTGGSGRSYIRKTLVENIGCVIRGETQIVHSLFGAHVTRMKKHSVYKVEMRSRDGTTKRQLELLDVDTICGAITNIPSEICVQELIQQGIILSDDAWRNRCTHWGRYCKFIVHRTNISNKRRLNGFRNNFRLDIKPLNNYLDNEEKKFENISNLITSSTYVDNCVSSVDTKEELNQFVTISKKICSEAKFNLRNWVWNRGDAITGDVSGVGSFECGLETGGIAFQETSKVVSKLGLNWEFGR